MEIFFIRLITFLYTDFLYMYVYKYILGMKYSTKITVLGTFVMWIFDVCVKLIPQSFFALENMAVIEVAMFMSSGIYLGVFYLGTVVKKVMLLFLYSIVQMGMDMLGYQLSGIVIGNFEFLTVNYKHTLVLVGCSTVFIIMGTIIFVWMWKSIEYRKYNFYTYQWLCTVLPLSQLMILQSMTIKNITENVAVPFLRILGYFIGIIAIIYMFIIFNRHNEKMRMEIELKQLLHQYELERLRFEEMKIDQEEIAKLRHDMQNYVLTIKSMTYDNEVYIEQ